MDLAAHRPLAAAVGTLREAVISLCSRIDGPGPRQDRSFRGLVTELRLLAGALYSLETLAADLEPVAAHEAHQRRPLTVLRRFQGLIESVDRGLGQACQTDIRAFKEETAVCRSRVTYVLARSQTFQDLALLLATQIEGDEMGRDAQQVCDWLDMLNSPYNDREPRDYYLERHFLHARRSEFPEYAYAATRWPVYAEAYWSTVQRQANHLFAMPRSFNFVQWALEYARDTWPGHFGTSCPDPGAVIDLTDALCDGSASPLHLAAALGLPSLCQSLLSAGADVRLAGRLGTPLYCALVGRDVLVAQASPESWSSVLRPGPELEARHVIVGQLLDAGSDCAWRFEWRDGGTVSLAGLAFWFACLVNDHTVLERVVAGGATFEDDFASLVTDPLFLESARPFKSTLSRLVTCAFDTTFNCEGDWPWYREDSVLATIKGLMRENHLSFAYGLKQSRHLEHVTDNAFSYLVLGAILDNELCYVRRLSMDARFDPDLPAHQQQDNGTVAHLAVGGDRLKLVDILMSAGADFTTRDGGGRTPLLLVESTRMLSKLVQHGLPTTDTDNKGRNIWHYAVATRDWGLLDWLAANDPSKEQNLASATTQGYTPLDEALGYIGRLRDLERCLDKPTEPVAALKILKVGASCTRPAPYPHFLLGVDWASLELVQLLLAAGADPRATDQRGMTALHHLNVAASPLLVSFVQHLCQGLPVGAGVMSSGSGTATADGLSPAETILTNTPFVMANGRWIPSEHPSCYATLSEEAYTLLLTPQVLGHHDTAGLGTWARFSYRVLPRLDDRLHSFFSAAETMRPLRASLLIALGCLIRHGALARYEAETGLPAVLCLADAKSRLWLVSRLAFAKYVLESFDSPLTQRFLRSPEALDLQAAADSRDEDLARLLASRIPNQTLRLPSAAGD